MRAALGASGARVVRQLLTESLVLAIGASLVGLVARYAGVRAARVVEPSQHSARGRHRRSTARVLFFTAVVALVTSVVFSLAPALRALRTDLTDSMKEGAPGRIERRRAGSASGTRSWSSRWRSRSCCSLAPG